MSRGRRFARAAGLTRNPMLRRSDRVEFSVRALLVMLFLVIGVPAGLVVGTVAHGNSSANSDGARETVAVVQKIPAEPGTAYARTVPADVRWTAPDGTLRTGRQAVPGTSHVGDSIPVWTDRGGLIIPRPPSAGDQMFTGILVGLLTVTAAACVLGMVMVAVRYRTDRRRYAGWDAEWRAVEPVWCKH